MIGMPAPPGGAVAYFAERVKPDRRFPPPWSVEEGETYFIVKDSAGQFDCYAH
jgi:hypothetical protein